MNGIRGLTIAISMLCLIAGPLFAADVITFSAQKVKSVYAQGREQTQLLGNARIKTGDISISADEITLYGNKQRYVESKTAVSIRDSKRNINLRGDSLFYDRETDILQISGNAELEDFKNEMLVKGGILESRNKENIAIVQVGVRVFKKDITARAEMLLYRRDDDLVELSGLPVVYKKDDQYKASTITINLKTEEIQMMGRVQGSVQTSSNKTPQPNPLETSPSTELPVSSPTPTPVRSSEAGPNAKQ